MDFKLKGKVAIICGGNKGLGAASADALAGEGTNLFLTARNVDQLEDIASRMRDSHGVEVETLAGDLTTHETADLKSQFAWFLSSNLRKPSPLTPFRIGREGERLTQFNYKNQWN